MGVYVLPKHIMIPELGLAALPALALSRLGAAEAAAGKPNSKVAGVQIGLNVPYSFGSPLMSGDEILKNCVELGLSGVELRTQPVEAFLGLHTGTGGRKKGERQDRGRLQRREMRLANRSPWTR